MSAKEFENTLGIKTCTDSKIVLESSSGRNGIHEVGLDIEVTGPINCFTEFMINTPVKSGETCDSRLNSCYFKNSKAEIYFYKLNSNKIKISDSI